MKLLVEVSQGLGNCVQGTPLLVALHRLGHQLDLFLNRDQDDAKASVEVWRGWPIIGQVFTHRREFDARNYDFGISGFGRQLMQRVFLPGMSLCVLYSAVRGYPESSANVDLARMLGYSGDVPQGYVGKSARDFGLPKNTVTVHAGCSWWAQEKRWPHWDQICARLKAEGYHVVIVGTPRDRSSESWEAAYDCRFDLGVLDLNALLSQALAHFGNDSGVAHLAGAVGLPGVILFGPTDPVKNAPNSRTLLALAAPRLDGEEHDQAAERPVPIARLTPDEVWAAIKDVLADPRRDPPRKLPAPIADSPEARARVVLPPLKLDGLDAMARLELEYQRQCAENLLSYGSPGASTREMIRRAGALQLEMARVRGAEGGKRGRHKSRAHAKDAIRAGYWMKGAIAYARGLL